MDRYILVHLKSPTTVPGGTHDNEIGDAYLRASLGKPSDAVEKGLYKVAALVEASDPEDLYVKTQNIDAPWTDVTKPIAGDMRQRSTTVGDFIFNANSAEVLFCACVGWEPAAPEAASAIKDLAMKALGQDGW
jgi:hypothetical protein